MTHPESTISDTYISGAKGFSLGTCHCHLQIVQLLDNRHGLLIHTPLELTSCDYFLEIEIQKMAKNSVYLAYIIGFCRGIRLIFYLVSAGTSIKIYFKI